MTIKRNNQNIHAFSLMELMVTIVLIGFATAFAVPTYKNAIQKANERDAVLILQTIHGANKIYKIKNDKYLQGDGNYSYINSNLGLNIIDSSSFRYQYDINIMNTFKYTASAVQLTSPLTQILINEEDIGPNNPCCKNPPGGCLYVPLCP